VAKTERLVRRSQRIWPGGVDATLVEAFRPFNDRDLRRGWSSLFGLP
jgi:hypothetical protein